VSTLAEDVKLTVANQRHASPQVLRKQLHGDLDWIVLKAIEKDRTRRYETANGLAADLKRHLDKEPVNARPPSTAYRLQKAMSRNKVAFGAGVAVVMALVMGIAGSVWQAVRAKSAEKRVTAALDELRASAPAFEEQARALAAREKFDEAIEKLDYALKLRPDVAEYYVAKADLLQCQFKLAEAAKVYRAALGVKADLGRAEASAKLCEELMAAPLSADGKLTRESLAKLHTAMLKQQRPAAELLPVARLLGEEKKLVLDYWLGRFKDLPVSVERPLKDRLSVREDGRLALDLSNTKVIDLSPLKGAPIASLSVANSEELTDLSPLRGLDLVELGVGNTGVTDLTPLREMRTLERLLIASTKVADLSPLSSLALKQLDLTYTQVTDLSPLRGMKLSRLSLRSVRVTDLSVLSGMPLEFVDLTAVSAIDFSPLAGAPLQRLWLQNTKVRDLSFLRGMPLRDLTLLNCSAARGFAVLGTLHSLELLVLPASYRELPAEELAAIESLRAHPTLKNLTSGSAGGLITMAPSKDVFWRDWDLEQTFVPALRKSGIKFTLTKLPAGTYSLYIKDQPLRDLSILKGAPITDLTLYGCPFGDLTPIRELKLEKFQLNSEFVSDLGPLRGMPLKNVYLAGAKITDLSPLAGVPLKDLYLDNCLNVTDVAVVAKIGTLENVTVPMWTRNIEMFRKLPGLQRLGYRRAGEGYIPDTTVAEFWKEYDANGWIAALRDAGMKAKTPKRLEDGTWDVDLGGIRELVDLKLLKGAPISKLGLNKTGVTDLSPLRGMSLKTLNLDGTAVSDITPLQGMRLEELNLANTKVSDLSALRGMPLTYLNAGAPAVTDLTPLRGIAIKKLWLTGTAVTDLSPLKGMPLEILSLSSNENVSDLSVLRGMPLAELRLRLCSEITDLSALADCQSTLWLLVLPPNASNLEFLRECSKIERISFQDDAKNGYRPDKTASEFWSQYDALQAHAHARASRWPEARRGFEQAIRLHAEDHDNYYRLAVILAQMQDREAYRAHCHALIELTGKSKKPEEMERTAKACSVLPLGDSDRAAVLRLAKSAASNETHQYILYFRFAQGLAQYRAGDYAAADTTLSELAKTEIKNLNAVHRVCVLAMAQQRLGKASEAQATLALAETRAAEQLPKAGTRDLGNLWNDVIVARMLLKEARELIEKK
jgi:Leucine-rich repeat (LRR) protein/Flp pilus assembly protein TadD